MLVAVAVVLVGVGLLYLGGRTDLWWQHHPGVQAVVNDLGALLIVSVTLGLLWELVGKRAFAREVLETARTSTDVEAAGLTRIGANYAEVPDWESLFATVRKLDIFVAYASTWRNFHLERLKKLAQTPDARIRVFLPDPQDSAGIERLAERFAKTPADLVRLIDEARLAYQSLPTVPGATVEVFLRPGDPVFSCYRFDRTAVLTLYTHQRERVGVPTLVCRDGGTLYQFVRQEFDALALQSRPAPTGPSPAPPAPTPAPPPTGGTP